MQIAGMLVAALAVGAVYGQSGEGRPSFEVASIKPAPGPEPGKPFVMGSSGGPGSNDPGMFRCTNCVLSMLIPQAYDVERYQVISPSGMDNERFNITAKIPPGTTKAQFRLMLQDLLVDRFKLAVHHDTKEMARYELVLAKGGSKMKEAVEEPAKEGDNASGPSAGSPPPPPPPPPGPSAFGGGGGRGNMTLDKDGFPAMPKMPGGRSAPRIMMMHGRARMESDGSTMAEFAKSLGNQLAKPVTDATGLAGKFQISLTWDGDSSGRMAGMPGLTPPDGGRGGNENTPLANTSDEQTMPTLFAALQSQLGLRLEQKKGSVDTVVIDHFEKVPTDN